MNNDRLKVNKFDKENDALLTFILGKLFKKGLVYTLKYRIRFNGSRFSPKISNLQNYIKLTNFG